jgi:hypothetical protein
VCTADSPNRLHILSVYVCACVRACVLVILILFFLLLLLPLSHQELVAGVVAKANALPRKRSFKVSLSHTPSLPSVQRADSRARAHTHIHFNRIPRTCTPGHTDLLPTIPHTSTPAHSRPNSGLVYQKKCSKARSPWQSASYPLQTQPGSAASASIIVEMVVVEQVVGVGVGGGAGGGQVSGQLTVPKRDRSLSFSSRRCERVYVRVFVCACASARRWCAYDRCCIPV